MQQDSSTHDTSVEQRFGARVADMRKEQGFSQRYFAQRLTEMGMPVDASAVSRMENGTRALRLSEAVIVAEALSTDIQNLMNESQTPQQRFGVLQRDVDRKTQLVSENLMQLYGAIESVQEYLDGSPQLVEALGEPYSSLRAGRYAEWLAREIQIAAEEYPFECYFTEGEGRARALESVAEAIARNSVAPWSDEVARYHDALDDPAVRAEPDPKRAATLRVLSQTTENETRGQHSEEG